AFVHWRLKWPDRFIRGRRGDGDKIGRGKSRPAAGRRLGAGVDRKRRLGVRKTAAGSRLLPSKVAGSEIILIDDSEAGLGLDVSFIIFSKATTAAGWDTIAIRSHGRAVPDLDFTSDASTASMNPSKFTSSRK